MVKHIVLAGLIFSGTLSAFSQNVSVVSPNQKIIVDLLNQQNPDKGEWFLKVSCKYKSSISVVIPEIILGLSRSDQDFSKDLRILKTGKQVLITDHYTLLHGKRSECSNSANETVKASWETCLYNPSRHQDRQMTTRKPSTGGKPL